MKKYGSEVSETIEWSAPRLICIAGDFTKYDAHAVQQINRNIELIKYQRFAEELLLLDLVHSVSVDSDTVVPATTTTTGGTPQTYKTVSEYLSEADPKTVDLFEAVKAYLLGLGDDVQVKTLKFYFAFKRIKNFACVEVRKQTGKVLIYAKVEPTPEILEEGFTRDVREIGHFGTGDLEITLGSTEDLERAMPLLEQSYEAN